jgi:polygalacturonase
MKIPFPTRDLFFLIVIIIVILAHQNAISQNGFNNVLDYGIKNDGATLNTNAIAMLIKDLHGKGGGTLYFPPGKYLTGSLHLKSHITLYLDAGATLEFSQNFDDFLPMVKSRHGGTEYTNFSPPIYAYKAENISIKGDGLIDGQGKAWWDFENNLKKEIEQNGKIASPAKWERMIYDLNKNLIDTFDKNADITNRRGYTFFRPPMIQFLHCKNVLIENVSMKDPPF